jgi:peptidylprolyl isomerase
MHYLVFLFFLCLACSQQETVQEKVILKPKESPIVNTENSLKIVDDKVGSGPTAAPGHKVKVHYVGTLDNGKQFDSSRDRNMPFEFALGAGQVIQGWDKGIVGMNVGGVRSLTIPPELAYGASAIGSIPAHSTLHFQVELLAIQ